MITMSIGDAGQSPLLSAHKSEKHFHSYDPSILRFDLNKIVGLKMRSVTCNRFPTFDSDDVLGRKQKSIHPGPEASRDVFSSDTGQGRQSGLKPD